MLDVPARDDQNNRQLPSPLATNTLGPAGCRAPRPRTSSHNLELSLTFINRPDLRQSHRTTSASLLQACTPPRARSTYL